MTDGPYSVYRAFSDSCWRQCKPLIEYDNLEDACSAADEKAVNYKFSDEAVFVVSTGRNGQQLYKAMHESRVTADKGEF